ncbi:MAG: hypothetical protein ACI9JL_002743 [Paracoccaceae bacterium]|jgi:hypothetical protein
MRKILFLFTFFAAAGLFGPASEEAAAQCTHLGGQGTCPVGIPNGSSSTTFNANGTINWSSGGISGACCAAPSGIETGGGLLNLNNQLGGSGPGTGNPPANNPNADSPFRTDGVNVAGPGEIPVMVYPDDCGAGGCTQGAAGQIFGANPNSGYLCDSGGPGCGNDLWTSAPQPGFGSCGPGGCGGAAPIAPINFAEIPGTGPYSQNNTTGEVDPFGGGSSFQDPITGETESLSDNPAEWPNHVRHADELNTAYANDEIHYPFDDPDWRNKSLEELKEDFRNLPPPGLDNISRPLEPYSTGNSDAAAADSGGTPSTGSAPKFSNKSGRFGIGNDTTLGGVNGLSARFQVAKNFGVQAIVSFTRVDINDENPNADLTNYVSAFLATTQPGTPPANFVSVLPVVTPTPSPASRPADEDTTEAPEPRSESTPLRTRSFDSRTGWDNRSSISRIETEGRETVYEVYSEEADQNRYVEFKSREDAFVFSDRLNDAPEGKTFDQVLGELPAERAPINVDPVNTNLTDTLIENVPEGFQAPKVNNLRLDEFQITDPRTGRRIDVKSAEQRDAVLNAMNNGATLKEAAEIAKNAPVVTPDGLASATTSSTPRSTQSTPAPAGSAPTFTDNRPAIIVAPTRPEGTSVGSMKGVIQGQAYDIEVIRAENGKVYAVGTGENANHVFGEVKETSNKLFGDWRREGPWTPPPSKTQTAPATTTATATTPTATSQRTPPPQAANNRVRSQIANSDRDYMMQPQFTDGFESGNFQAWTTTNP